MSDITQLLAEVENDAYKVAKTSRILVGKATALLQEHADAEAALAQAITEDSRTNREPQAIACAERVREIEDRIEDAKTAFRFVAIGRRKWADLVALHPPSKDDLKRDARADINSATFPIAAVAASCADPKMSEDEARRLEMALNDTQWQRLWSDCLEVNLGGLATPKSHLAGSILRASEPSATTAANAGFPAPSSSAE